MANRKPLQYPRFQAWDDDETFLNGGTITFYDAGTTNKRNVYQDAALTTTAPNPVNLNSRGEPESAGGTPIDIYLDSNAYKIVLKDSSGVTVHTIDGYIQNPNPLTPNSPADAKDQSTDVFEGTLNNDPVSGDIFEVDFKSANTTTTPTFKNTGGGLGALTIKTWDKSPVWSHAISGVHSLYYDGTDYLVINPHDGIRTVDSLSNLQALVVSNIPDGYTAYLRGRSSLGDGGEGPFRWNSSDLSTEVGNDEITANEGDGGIYVAPAIDKTGASGAWVRQWNDAELWVEWYGAVADNSTDNSTAIQAALDAADVLDDATVRAGAGIFRGDGYTITGSVSLIGAGIKQTFFRKANDNLLLDAQNSHGAVEGITFDSAIADTTDGVRINANRIRTIFEVAGVGGDGVVYNNGNLCDFKLIRTHSNGGHGFYANVVTVDTNASQFGLIDTRSNGKKGFWLEAKGDVDDAANSRQHYGGPIVAQENGEQGCLIETRGNILTLYGEANTGNDIELNTAGCFSNFITTVAGNITDNTTSDSNVVFEKQGVTSEVAFNQLPALKFRLPNHDFVADFDWEHSSDNTVRVRQKGSGTNAKTTFDTDGSAEHHVESDGDMLPAVDNTHTSGRSSLRWSDVFAASGSVNASDEKEKKNVSDEALGEAFMRALRPVSFKRIDGTSGRTHHGLIAQEVERVLTEMGYTNQDFAGLVRTTLIVWEGTEAQEQEDGTTETVPVRCTAEEGEDNPSIPKDAVEVDRFERYGLRYDQFIGPLVKTVQSLDDRLSKLEGK